MPRPRRPFSGQETIERFPTVWMMDLLPGKLGTRRQRRWESSHHWSYSTPNGVQDPLTYLLVLDALMNIDPSIELRSVKLVEWLNGNSSQLTWDSVTVGKVVSDLCDQFESVLGEKNGLLERGRDWRGQFYVFHRSPEAAEVAYALRDDLYKLVENERTVRANGEKTDFMGSPLLECPSLRGEFVPLDEDEEEIERR